MARFVEESPSVLRAVALALRSGQLTMPLSRMGLSRVSRATDATVEELLQISAEHIAPEHLAELLDFSAAVTESRALHSAAVELVWTGPESPVTHSRDTFVVLSELFSHAERQVLVSSFVVRQGSAVFEPLAKRMDERPALVVQLFVHVPREPRDTRDESELVRAFADGFQAQWPWPRRPEVFYDPRTVSLDSSQRATWHAKCVVVDDDQAFVTSANFTEWAQQRNVEAGVLVRDVHFAAQLRQQFAGLVQTKQVRRLPGW